MSNGVEDLERQVAELQAAVNGLTEELVETKERVRQLEDARATSVEETAAESAPDDGDRTTHSGDHVDVFEPTDEDAPDAADSEQSATPDAEAGGGDDGDGESTDDIIVA